MMGLTAIKTRVVTPIATLWLAGLCLCAVGGHTAHAAGLRGGFSAAVKAASSHDIVQVKRDLTPIIHSPEIIIELDKIIGALDENAPKMFRVELELFKLDSLAKIGDPSVAADYAAKIYADHPRESFPSEIEYGDTMYQIVESLAKTDNLGVSYDIIQKLRYDLYDNPNIYLSFIVKKSLIEVYVETSDYQRALNLALSVINDNAYMDVAKIKAWRPRAMSEIAYLYNKLGNGQQALMYLEEAYKTIETQDPSLKSVKKARALNYANRGRAYLLVGDYAETRRMGERVLEANKTLNQVYLTAVGHRLIGCADLKTGNHEGAAAHLRTGLDLMKDSDNLSLKRALYFEYATALEKLDQHKSAAYWYKQLYALELKRQSTIASTRAKLNDIEFSALKMHQEVTYLHHELDHSQSINKLMLFAIFSLFLAGCILTGLLSHLRRNQRKLKKSEIKAQTANVAKSEFLANMSHEIRTPLNGVIGMAQVLERTPLSHQQKTYLDILKQSGTTLLDLINDILDFSKIEADKLTLNYETHNLDQIIRDVVHLLSPNAHAKNIALHYVYDSDFPEHLLIDGKRVRQIVTNLIGNALKFTKEGAISVTVSGFVQNNAAHVKISVTDTGIGIAADQIDTIFEKFTQVGDTSKQFYGGTGLGLAISKKLAESMSGDLSVTSTLGEGSSFTFNLPAKLAAAGTKPQSPTKNKNISQAA